MNKDYKKIDNILNQRERLSRSSKLHWMHWFIIVSSLILTFGAWHFSNVQLKEKIEIKFDRQADHVINLIYERMEKYENALWSGVAAIQSQSYGIDYQEWKRFSETLEIHNKYKGINGIGIIYNVLPQDFDQYLETQRQIRPNYKIYPAHDKKEYLPITYIEPVSNNMKAVGLDIAHEENRYNAALKARDTGLSQMTGPIKLVQDSQQTPGFLLYAPFYQKDSGGSIEERRSNFIGLVYAPFIVKNLMAGVLESKNRQIFVKIYDGEEILYSEYEDNLSQLDSNPLFKKAVEVKKYGRHLTFEIETKNSFRVENNYYQPQIILLGGITIDILLFSIFVLLTRSNKRVLDFSDIVTEDYRNKVEELSRSNTELERFAFIASHDLQEPLRMVSSFTELLEKEYSEKFDDQAHFYMKNVKDSSSRMRMLIRGLLEYSQVQKSRDNKNEIVDFKKCLEEAEFNLSELIEGSNANVSAEENYPKIKCTPSNCTRLLQNLIGNAIKYKHPDRNPNVSIQFKENEVEYVFSIADNGIGIDKQYFDKIFSIFERLHSKNEYDGTGIGLAICKKIVELWGGRIWVESDLGHGSTFHFSVPKIYNEE